MSVSNQISIDSTWLHTNIIKTSKLSGIRLDNIRSDNGPTMRIEADKCNITGPSIWTLETDDSGSTQIFKTYSSEYFASILSIVPKDWELIVNNPVRYAQIDNNEGHVQSSDYWSAIHIEGAQEVSLDVSRYIQLFDVSTVNLTIPSSDWSTGYPSQYSNGWVSYYVKGVHYDHMHWEDVYTKVGTGWYDADTCYNVIRQGTANADCPYTVKITAWYDTTFNITD